MNRLFHLLVNDLAPEWNGRIKGKIAESAREGFLVSDTADGKLQITGGSPLELAAGLNAYLKERLNWHDSWCGSRRELPAEPPTAGTPINRHFQLTKRPYLNYCTFGYSLVWWQWEDWKREINRMALNGINMPLAVTGIESVWQQTFLHFGLNREEICAFLSGPAFLPWQWMNNLNSHAGPLPQSWIDSHRKLGRRIIKRERDWGMTPILPCFSGQVPETFVARHPEVRYIRSAGWCGFAPVALVDPGDPMFSQILQVYLAELHRAFGTVHYYSIDLFHEQQLEQATPEYFARCGREIIRALLTADPDAVWVMQAWSDRADIIQAIPPKHLLMLDIGQERLKKTDGLYGVPTAWGTIHSFGGQTEIGGDLAAIPREISEQRKRYSNLVGAGAFPESIFNNPVLFELIFDSALAGGEMELNSWLNGYLQRRYGMVSPAVRQAWTLMLRDVYTARRGDPIFAARPALTLDRANAFAGFKSADCPERFFPAWRALLAAADEGIDSEGFRFDVIDLGRQALSSLGQGQFQAVRNAFSGRDLVAFRKAANGFLALMDDCDRLLATRPEFCLAPWLLAARRCGKNEKEKNLYEFNARLLITLWGPVSHPEPLFDYCCREQSGLLSDYYAIRWRKFFDFLENKLKCGEAYDDCDLPKCEGRILLEANPFYKELFRFEQDFVGKTSDDSELAACCDNQEDELECAKMLYWRYAPISRTNSIPQNHGTQESDLLTGFKTEEEVVL